MTFLRDGQVFIKLYTYHRRFKKKSEKFIDTQREGKREREREREKGEKK